MAKFCANCGSPLNEGEKFCGKCGTKVEDFVPEANNANNAEAANSANAENTENNVQNNQSEQTPTAADTQQAVQAAAVTQQPQQQYQQPQQATPPQPKGPNPAGVWVKNHKTPLIIAAAGVVLAVAAIIILVNILKYQVIDPKDIACLQVAGPSSAATGEVVLNDVNAIYSFYDAKSAEYEIADAEGKDTDNAFDHTYYKNNIKDLSSDDCSPYFNPDRSSKFLEKWSKADDKSDAKIMMNALLRKKNGEYLIKFTADKTEGLKNGDKIKVKVTYDEEYLKEYNIKLSSDEFEVEVKDLPEATKLDMFKGVSLDCSEGVNGSAVAVSNSDSDSRNVITIKSSGDNSNYIKYSFNEFKENSDDYEDYYDYNDESPEDAKTYSNGDKIKVYAKLTNVDGTIHETKNGTYFTVGKKYYLVSKKTDSKEFEVSGLKEPEEIDIFTDVSFSTSGVSPELSLDSDWNGNNGSLPDDNPYRSAVVYRTENAKNLAIGDTFKAYCKVDTNYLESLGYKVSNEEDASAASEFGDSDDDTEYKYYSKEISIDDSFPHYITTKADAVSAEKNLKNYNDENIFDVRASDAKDDMVDWSIGVVKSLNDGVDRDYISDVTKVKAFTYVGSCFSFTSKNVDGSKNYVTKIYKTTVIDKSKKTHTFYTAVYAYNVYKAGDELYCEGSNYACYKSLSLLYKAGSTNDEDKALKLVKYKN